METIIVILIIIGTVLIKNNRDKKWYENLDIETKTKIKELDLRLTDLNYKVKNKMPKKYRLYKFLLELSKNLLKDEEIIFFTEITLSENINFSKGFLYITNKRILIKTKKYEKNISLEKISSVDSGKIMRNNWLKVNDNSTTIQLNNIPKQDINKVKEEINKGTEKHKNISINITQTTEKDISDKIARLKVLFEEGVLTEYEFNMKKLELLDKIK
jgi:hypothetical protein